MWNGAGYGSETEKMYLHIGQDTVIRTREVLGIFDLDTATVSQDTRAYLAAAERAGRVVTVTSELPKSFIVTRGAAGTVYLSQISAGTLRKRSGAAVRPQGAMPLDAAALERAEET